MKKYLLFLSILLSVNLVYSHQSDSVKYFYDKLTLKSDDGYVAFLKDNGHLESLPAHNYLILFVKALEPQTYGVNQGFRINDRKLNFWWHITEFSTDNSRDIFYDKADKYFEYLDFKSIDYENKTNDKKWYQLEMEPFVFLITLINFEDYDDANISGGEVLFEIVCDYKAKLPKVADVLQFYPAVKCEEMNKSVYNLISSQFSSEISYGGSRLKYYIWNTKLNFENQKQTSKFYKKLIKNIELIKYKLINIYNGTHTYIKSIEGKNSFIYINYTEYNMIQLGFQANS